MGEGKGKKRENEGNWGDEDDVWEVEMEAKEVR